MDANSSTSRFPPKRSADRSRDGGASHHDAAFSVGVAHLLFEGTVPRRRPFPRIRRHSRTVSAFSWCARVEQPPARITQMVLVQNWFQELKAKAPAKLIGGSLPGTQRRPIRNPLHPRRRRHGRSLSSARSPSWPECRAQGAAREVGGGCRRDDASFTARRAQSQPSRTRDIVATMTSGNRARWCTLSSNCWRATPCVTSRRGV
jgi:hypothetical protein